MLAPITDNPRRARAVAHSGGRGRLRDRPSLLDHTTRHRQTALRAQSCVSVNLHPVTSVGVGLQQPPASKEARMNNLLRNYG
jgi:hypothetical protein